MRNLILAAGVAALAITAPSVAKHDRDGSGERETQVKRAGGGQAKAQRRVMVVVASVMAVSFPDR